MTRQYTQELKRAEASGKRIVCAMAPYEGCPVSYKPRSKGDPFPWVLAGYRFTGRECMAVPA